MGLGGGKQLINDLGCCHLLGDHVLRLAFLIDAAKPGKYGRTVDGPPNWETLERHNVGPFTTSMRFRRPDGIEVEWSAWRHRKGLGLIQPSDERAPGGRWWWAPHRIGW